MQEHLVAIYFIPSDSIGLHKLHDVVEGVILEGSPNRCMVNWINIKVGKSGVKVETYLPESMDFAHQFAELESIIQFSILREQATKNELSIQVVLEIGILFDTANCTLRLPSDFIGKLAEHEMELEFTIYPTNEVVDGTG